MFLSIFARDAKILRSWEPERGLNLDKFIGFVAERQVVSILRTQKRDPWTEEPTLSQELEADLPRDTSTEDIVASRNALERLLEKPKEELSPLGWQLFDLVYVQQLSVEEVVSSTGMSADAVYAWRSRLSRLARERYAELAGETAATVGR